MKTTSEMNAMTIEELTQYQVKVEDEIIETLNWGQDEEYSNKLIMHNEEITAVLERKYQAE